MRKLKSIKKFIIGVGGCFALCSLLVQCWTIAIEHQPIWVFLFPCVFYGVKLGYHMVEWGDELRKEGE